MNRPVHLAPDGSDPGEDGGPRPAHGDHSGEIGGHHARPSRNDNAASAVEASNSAPPRPPPPPPPPSAMSSFSHSVPGLKFVSKLTGLSFFSKSKAEEPTTASATNRTEAGAPFRPQPPPPPSRPLMMTTSHVDHRTYSNDEDDDHDGDDDDDDGDSDDDDDDDARGGVPTRPPAADAASETDSDDELFLLSGHRPPPPHNADPLNAYGGGGTTTTTTSAKTKTTVTGTGTVPRKARPWDDDDDDDDNTVPPPPSMSRSLDRQRCASQDEHKKEEEEEDVPPPPSQSRPKAVPPSSTIQPSRPVSQPPHAPAGGKPTTTPAAAASPTTISVATGPDPTRQASAAPSTTIRPSAANAGAVAYPQPPTAHYPPPYQPHLYPYMYPVPAPPAAPPAAAPWGGVTTPAPTAAAPAAAPAAATAKAVPTLARSWPPDDGVIVKKRTAPTKAGTAGRVTATATATSAAPSQPTQPQTQPQPVLVPPQQQPPPPSGSNAYPLIPYPPGYGPYYPTPVYHYPSGYPANYYNHQQATAPTTANAKPSTSGKPPAMASAAKATAKRAATTAAAAAAATKGPASKKQVIADKSRQTATADAPDMDDSDDDWVGADDGNDDDDEEQAAGWQLLKKMARELEDDGPGVAVKGAGPDAGRPSAAVVDPMSGLHEVRLLRKRVRDNDALSIVPYPPRTIGSVRDNPHLLRVDDEPRYLKKNKKKTATAGSSLPSPSTASEATAVRGIAKRAVVVNKRVVPGLCTSRVDFRWKDLTAAKPRAMDAPDVAAVRPSSPTATDAAGLPAPAVPAVLVHDLMLSPSKAIPAVADGPLSTEPTAKLASGPAGPGAPPSSGPSAAPGPTAAPGEALPAAARSEPGAAPAKKPAKTVPSPPSTHGTEVSGTCVERYWHDETHELQRFLSAVKRCVHRRPTWAPSIAVAGSASLLSNAGVGERPIDRQAQQFLDVLEHDVAAVRKAAYVAEQNARTHLKELGRPVQPPQHKQHQNNATSQADMNKKLSRDAVHLTDPNAPEAVQDTGTGAPELSAEEYQRRIVTAAREAAIFRETARIIRRKARELCERRTASAP